MSRSSARISLVAAALAALAAPAFSKSLHVPQQYPTIADAVDFAGHGDVILVAPGQHAGGVLIRLKSHVSIRGAGKNKTTVSGDAAPLITSVFQVEESTDVSISDLTIEGTADSSVESLSCRNLTIRNCRVRGEGMEQPGPIYVRDSENVRIEGVALSGLHSFAFLGVTGPIGGALTLSHCRFEDVGVDAITVAANDVHIDHCRFERVDGHAITVLPGDLIGEATLENNVIVDCTDDAVVLNSEHRSRVERNRITRPAGVGIFVQTAAEAIVRDNIIDTPEDAGIRIDIVGAVVDGNRVKSSLLPGVVANGAEAIVTRNVIAASRSVGISVFGPNARVRDNRIFESADSGILADASATAADLRGNDVMHPTNHGVEIRAANCALTRNRVKNAQVHGFEITSSGNTLAKNSAHGSTLSDLHCDLQTNTIAGNNHFGTVEDIP